MLRTRIFLYHSISIQKHIPVDQKDRKSKLSLRLELRTSSAGQSELETR
jgi:hypothetical protein